jgi:hypothetical protein
MAKRKKSPVNVPDLDILEQINVDAAGLDIGAEEIYACVPVGRDETSVRVFPTFTVDLHALADWMAACRIKTIAMESTGIYWIPVYEILESRGFDVYLVNARHIKNVPGRKTDILDCQWIQQLHTYGLLRASFRPAEDICALRAMARHRDNLIRYRSAHIQHMQKALELMNVKLTQVVSDITGVTGVSIIRAIVAGERDPHKLARFRQAGCKRSEEQIAKALQATTSWNTYSYSSKPWLNTISISSRYKSATPKWRRCMVPCLPRIQMNGFLQHPSRKEASRARTKPILTWPPRCMRQWALT